MLGSVSILVWFLDNCSYITVYYVCVFNPYLHAGMDFNDTVILTKVPAAQTQLAQAIQIFDDEINEGREVFNVSLEVVGNISNAVMYTIQTTRCRIRQSDRKLCCKVCMYTFQD